MKAWIAKDKRTVGWYENGHRHSKTCSMPEQARELKSDIEYRMNHGLSTSLMTVAWERLKYDYIKSKKADRRAPATIREINNMFYKFETLVGRPKSTEITQEHIDKFKALRSNEDISGNTVNKDLANFKAFLRYFSIDRLYIRPNLKVTFVKAKVKPIKSLDEEQIGRLLRYLKINSPSYYIRALLALSAGLDAGTIDNIMIQYINFDTNTIDTYRPKKNKWHLNRPIQEQVMKEIANFMAEQPAGQFRLLPDLYRRNKWVMLCQGAGIKTTFHNLRKTFGSLLQKKGVSLAVAQDLLDHESVETTRKYYTDVNSEHQAATNRLPVNDWIQ